MVKRILPLLVLFTFINCGPTIIVPPEIDLIPYERVGLISFSIENAEGQLGEMATQRFLQEITRHQRGAQVIELGSLDEVLGEINHSTIDQEAISAIGEHFGVTLFFYGEIKVSDVKPQIDIAGLIQHMRVQATFDISMTARLFSTETGATLWTDSAVRKGVLAYMHMGQDMIPYFDLREQEESYRRLTEHLVYDLTRDFRPSKQRM